MMRISSYTKRLYRGRFAPNPSGPLHDGSLLAAMASFLDARAHRGEWIVRIEDIDTPRVVVGAEQTIMQQLHLLGMDWDGVVIRQSERLPRYQEVFLSLSQQHLVYGCSCTRKEIADRAIALGHHKQGQYPYSGNCCDGTIKPIRAWRLRMPSGVYSFRDRWLGEQSQAIQEAVGDIVIKRADDLFAYQLVVVVDDHDQNITHIVRGQDLLDSTQRQQVIAEYLGWTSPSYMHIPLVLDADGRKLSKQNHAPAIDTQHALSNLHRAWQRLGFSPIPANTIAAFWPQATAHWAQRFVRSTKPTPITDTIEP